VNVGHLLAAQPGRLEGHARDARDLHLIVHHGVTRLAKPVDQRVASRLAEVEPPRELPHDEQVDSRHHFRAQGRRVGERRKHVGGPQVGEEAEFLADAQESALGALGERQAVPLRTAHRTEKNRASRPRSFEDVVANRRTVRIDRCAADQALFECELDAGAPRGRFEDAHSLLGDFGSDSVAR
jgi:hypothetical protein